MADKQKHTCFDCKHHYYEEYWHGQAEKYKQALQEIKEIAKNNEVCPYDFSHHCFKNNCKKEHCEIAQILQKCEVTK